MESGLKEMQDVSFNSRFCVFAKGLLRCAKVQKGMVIIMKQYLSALIQKIGRLNVSIYLLLLSVGYGLYSILPYTLPKIFSGSGGLHVNPFFMVLSILSFLVVPILNYPNNLAMQSVRKYSKQVLFDDLVKKNICILMIWKPGRSRIFFPNHLFVHEVCCRLA